MQKSQRLQQENDIGHNRKNENLKNSMTKKCTGMIEHCFGVLSELGGGGVGSWHQGWHGIIHFREIATNNETFSQRYEKITKFRVFRQKTDFRIFRENSFVPTLGGRSFTKQHVTQLQTEVKTTTRF